MGSVSAVRSPEVHGRFLLSNGSIEEQFRHIQHPFQHQLQYHHHHPHFHHHHRRRQILLPQQPPLSSGSALLAGGGNSVVVGGGETCSFGGSERLLETDFSSPTSWEFRDNLCEDLSRRSCAHSPEQMPATLAHSSLSSSFVLPPPPPPQLSTSSSSGSSTATPSPSDEAPYQVQMHLSLLRSTPPVVVEGGGAANGDAGTPRHCRSHRRPSHLSTTCHGNNSGGVINQNGTISANCSNNNCACGGCASQSTGDRELSGSGSDGSRNSTGSHRSQDSGFSDSGETRRSTRKCSGSNDTFNHSLHLHHPHLGGGSAPSCPGGGGVIMNGSSHQNSNGQCNGSITHDNGYHNFPSHNHSEPGPPQLHESKCCEQPVSSPYNHYGHIYDCISMPSPIPASGFGCGRLGSTPTGKVESRRSTPTPTQHFISPNGMNYSNCNGHYCPPEVEYATYTTTLPRRPASVDISLEKHYYGNGVKCMPESSPPPRTTTCTSCLSSSSGGAKQEEEDHYRCNTKRSFSPQRTSSPHPHHDIALLASASTATAVAALRVPLSCSTPKRPNSMSRLGTTATSGMVKIDNFESLNKNVNKDNNNNSSSNGSNNGGTPPQLHHLHPSLGKSGNKTFTVTNHAPQVSTTESSRGSLGNSQSGNGTVLVNKDEARALLGLGGKHETAHSSAKLNHAHSSTSARSQSRPRTAAESIYDKICSRLSSLSSSSSSSSSCSTPSTSATSAPASTTVLSNGLVSSNGVTVSPSIFSKENETVLPNGSTTSGGGDLCETSQNEESAHSSRCLARPSGAAKWDTLPRNASSKRLSLLVEKNCEAVVSGVEVDYPVDVSPAPYSHPPQLLPSDPLSPAPEQKPARPESLSRTVPKATPSWTAILDPQAHNQVVRLWLQDLRTQTEPECLHSLQTKWVVPADELEEEDELTSRSISPATTVTTGTSGDLISSSTCPPPSSDDTSRPYSMTSTSSQQNLRKFSGASSSSSYLCQQLQRRSQQKFLSSMTAAIHAVSTPLMSIRNVEMTANVISGEFSKICKHLEFGIFTQVPTLVLSLVGHIEDFLRVFPNSSGFANLSKLESRLGTACYALHMAAKSMSEAALMMSSSSDSGHNSNTSSSRAGSNSSSQDSSHHRHPRSSSTSSSASSSTSASSPDGPSSSSGGGGSSGGDPFSQSSDDQGPDSLGREYHVIVSEVVEGIVTVGNMFSQVVDLRLTRDLACILDTIEGGGIPARVALKSLVTVLADGGNHICRLAADIRTVRGLLGVLLDTREAQDKILALRCLATVLCVGEAVKDFDKAGGFEIIADLLYEPTYSMSMKIEAVAVLTQATDPWIDLETTLMTLGVHLEKFIVSLTKLVRDFKTEEEPFLLIVAAISNLTFLEVAATEYLKKSRTVSYLIEVATILANMAGVESCRQEIIQCGGIDALLKFLEQRPSRKTDSVSAITACERLQQKSTIALSRLSNEDGVARYVFDRGGVHRLVTLCRKEKERNYSDGVLIAALATLRKLITTCGPDVIQGLGAEDLIEPRLLDSFLLYSSRQESYV